MIGHVKWMDGHFWLCLSHIEPRQWKTAHGWACMGGTNYIRIGYVRGLIVWTWQLVRRSVKQNRADDDASQDTPRD